eukprot:13113268-Alexandrium_andersonii.AAC.1
MALRAARCRVTARTAAEWPEARALESELGAIWASRRPFKPPGAPSVPEASRQTPRTNLPDESPGKASPGPV